MNKKGLIVLTFLITISMIVPFCTCADVEILSSSYSENFGYGTIVGEVENVGSSNREYVKITATFYDSNENVLDTSFSFTGVDVLLPGQKSPFKIMSLESNLPVDHYSLQVDNGYTTSASPYRLLDIKGVTESTSFGYYTIRGEVENYGSIDATYVKVISTLYNSQGEVIGTDFTFTDPSDINAGRKAPFEIMNMDDISPASYELQVTCMETMPASSITCNIEDSNLIIGDQQTITGVLDPSLDTSIVLAFEHPDESITFAFPELNNGEYSYSFEPEEVGDWQVGAYWEGNVAYGESYSSVKSFSVNEAPKTGNIEITIEDQDGNPLLGVSVSSTSEPSGQEELSDTSNSQGVVTFSDVFIGSYNFELSKNGYEEQTGSISVQEDTTVSQTFQIQEQIASIEITVEDESGNPLTDATVKTTSRPSGQTSLSAETSNGEATFDNILPGSYTFEATLSGYEQQTKSVTISSGETAKLDFTLNEIQETQTSDSDSDGGIPGYPIEAVAFALVLIILFFRKQFI